tara:strand:+ start:358 stop:1056 length:699 start_codon:yes stop_codon:yes gene_type:complete
LEELDIFIKGEIIDLKIPTREFAKNSLWYSLFNSKHIIRFLEHGVFPNTKEQQEKFFSEQSQKRLLLIITNKENIFKGVISLSSFDFFKRHCTVEIVADPNIDKRISPYQNLEAISLITEYGFKTLGMHRIEAGQHEDLNGWQQRMELIGYKLEGIHTNKFCKGDQVANTVTISCIRKHFEYIYSLRNNKLWDSLENMKKRIKALPKESFAELLRKFFNNKGEDYYNKIYKL